MIKITMVKNILSEKTIDRILPKPKHSVKQIEDLFVKRNLPQGAEVVRVAPSPTGFMHLGTLYVAFICKTLARQSGGVYYLRLEDTDRKREVEGARELIMESLEFFDLMYDEGPIVGGDKGEYGPYTQSHRREFYHAYTRQMLESGDAYPCFLTPHEQEQMVAAQKNKKIRPGYWGEWALWRDKSEEEVAAALDAGKPFVIRFRSEGDISKKRIVDDLIKGKKELPENDNDIVILKNDGLPTYHLAHIVDDYLMRTTTIVRADEWFPSVTLHIQLAEAAGIKPFTYAHVSPIQKMDGSSRRKLSKRKDPEANVAFYEQQGYPAIAVLEYMLNLANSNFEDWRKANSNLPYTKFEFKLGKMQKNAGALLDVQKLDDISRNYLAGLSVEQLYELSLGWADKFDANLKVSLQADHDYTLQVFSIERENSKRKDIVKLSDLRDSYGFFFDEVFAEVADFDFGGVSKSDVSAILKDIAAGYSPDDDQATWFDKLKAIGERHGFTSDTKEFRKNPGSFKGSVADVAMVLRVALTGRNRSPNLHEVMRIMGVKRVGARLKKHF